MARLNVNDDLWSDSRFLRLCVAMGDDMKAVGAVVIAWKLAQKFWCPEMLPIPEEAFREARLPEALIETGLAERTPQGVRIRGCESHFSWWFEKQKAGKVGAAKTNQKRWSRQESSGDDHPSSGDDHPSSDGRQKSPSSSSSSSKANIREGEKPVGAGEGKTTPLVEDPIPEGHTVGSWVKLCNDAYDRSLEKLGLPPARGIWESTVLQLVRSKGATKTYYAILGLGEQETNGKFKPREQTQLSQLSSDKNIQRLVPLGMTALTRIVSEESGGAA